MALADEVASRYSDQILVNLTNPGVQDQTTINSARMNRAASDVEAMFQVRAMVEFDIDDARHVAIAVEGVIALLEERSTPGPASRERMKEFSAALAALADTTSRARVSPRSNSDLQVSDETDGGTRVRTAFDRSRFSDLTVDPPGPESSVED